MPDKSAPDVIDQLTTWINTQIPQVPAERDREIAKAFLTRVADRRPDLAEALRAGRTDINPFASELLRESAATLSAPEYAALREQLARRRVGIILKTNQEDASDAAANSAIERLNTVSSVYKRKLVEGKVDDDDLWLLLKRIRGHDTEKQAKAAVPHELTAAEIVDEYARRNQTGAAAQKLQAYSMQATLRTATGTTQKLTIFRMRPDLLRLVVSASDSTELVLIENGGQYWQEAKGQPTIAIPTKDIGSRKYLAEFLNPLFAQENYTFQRIEDEKIGDQKIYRLKVTRHDGSEYISCINAESFREVAHEKDNGLKIELNDFRDLGGVTVAYHETITSELGQQSQLQVERATANPGLIADLFQPNRAKTQEYYSLEAAFAAAEQQIDGGASR